MQKRITLTSKGARLVEAEVQAGRKIGAIKACRLHGTIHPGDPTRDKPHSVGLKEAKQAIEAKYFGSDEAKAVAIIGPSFIVKSLVVGVCGEGDVELNIDELQFRFLNELNSLGLDQVQRLLELTEYIRDWQGPQSINPITRG